MSVTDKCAAVSEAIWCFIIDWANSAECSAFNSRIGDREKYTFQVKLNFYKRLVKYLPDETSLGVQPQITVLRDKSSYPLRVFTRADTNLNQRRRIPNSYYFYIEDPLSFQKL